MKKLLVFLALLTVSASQMKAQTNAISPAGPGAGHGKRTPAERAQKDADWAEQKLGLSADQKSKWQQASLDRIAATDPLKDQMRGQTDPAEKERLSAQMKESSKKFDATVDGFLTADQKQKWEQAKQERKSMHHDRGNAVGSGDHSPADTETGN